MPAEFFHIRPSEHFTTCAGFLTNSLHILMDNRGRGSERRAQMCCESGQRRQSGKAVPFDSNPLVYLAHPVDGVLLCSFPVSSFSFTYAMFGKRRQTLENPLCYKNDEQTARTTRFNLSGTLEIGQSLPASQQRFTWQNNRKSLKRVNFAACHKPSC